MRVEVCYAWDAGAWRATVELAPGDTLAEAVERSGLHAAFEETRGLPHGLGVHGKRRAADALARDGDRIEVYRPLTVDPKIARQRRVEKQRAAQPDRWVRR